MIVIPISRTRTTAKLAASFKRLEETERHRERESQREGEGQRLAIIRQRESGR